MKKLLALLILGTMFLFVLMTSCSKEDNNNGNNQIPAPTQSASLSGFGNHGGYPSGSPYALPTNIKLIGSMYGGTPPGFGRFFDDEKSLKNIDEYQASSPKLNYTEYGIGTYVDVYMVLFNNSNSPYNLIIPGGLILCDSTHGDTTSTDTTQSGIIIVNDTMHFRPMDTLGVCLKSFCTNLHYGIPYGNKYTFSVVTNNEQMCQLLGLLRHKKSLAEHVSEIQGYIWQITDGTGLTQADIDTIKSWQ